MTTPHDLRSTATGTLHSHPLDWLSREPARAVAALMLIGTGLVFILARIGMSIGRVPGG
jgi:hypothetical protein